MSSTQAGNSLYVQLLLYLSVYVSVRRSKSVALTTHPPNPALVKSYNKTRWLLTFMSIQQNYEIVKNVYRSFLSFAVIFCKKNEAVFVFYILFINLSFLGVFLST